MNKETDNPWASEEADNEMLSLIVNDALEGIDITTRYPSFYRKMVSNPLLHEAFIDALDILEKDRAGALEPLPESASHDLSFLKEFAPSTPLIEQAAAGRWAVTWQRTKEQIQALFENFEPARPLAYRSGNHLDNLEAITLLRGNVQVDGITVEMWLEASQPVDIPEMLHLFLTTAVPHSPNTPQPALQATIQWGGYRETATIDQYGRALFPLLPLQTIVGESGQITSSLQLKLESSAD